MKLYTLLLWGSFILFSNPLLYAQVMAAQKAGADSLLYQAHYYKNCARFATALVYAEKSVAYYQSQNPSKLAEAYFTAGLLCQNLGEGVAADAYYQKVIFMHQPANKSQKWKNYFALRAKVEWYKKYKQNDSLDYALADMIKLNGETAGVEKENDLHIIAYTFLHRYYFNLQQYDLAGELINKGLEVCQKATDINPVLRDECLFFYYKFKIMSNEEILTNKRKAKELLRKVQTAVPLLPNLVLHGYKTAYIADMYSRDSAGLFEGFEGLRQFTAKNYGLQSTQMAYYYVDYAVMLKDRYAQKTAALALFELGLPLLEKGKSPIDKNFYLITCLNAGELATAMAKTASEYARARVLIAKGLQKAIQNNSLEFKLDDLPNFADNGVSCDEPIIAFRLLKSLYQNYYKCYEQSFSPSEQKTLLHILAKINQLHDRNSAALQNESNFNNVAYEYQKIQSDYIQFYRRAYLKDKRPATLEAIFMHAENSKSIATRRQLNQAKAFELAGVAKNLILEYMQTKTALQNLQIRQSIANNEARIADWQRLGEEIIDKKIILQQQEADLQQKYPRYAALMYKPPVATIADMQQNMDKHTAFLYFGDCGKTELQIIICKDTAWLRAEFISYEPSLYPPARMQTMLYEWDERRENDKIQLDSFRAYYRHWGKNLIGNETIFKNKNIDKLMISPAQYSSLIPFELLLLADDTNVDSYKNFSYTLKNYPLQYVNSGSLWLQNKQQAAQNTQNGKILAFAATYKEGFVNKKRAKSLNNIRANLSELKGVLNELDNLKTYYYGDYRRGAAAHEAGLKADVSGKYSILHLAMHGIWDGENPELSALILSETADTTEDNFLNAYEIAELQHGSQLVVLSACETAKGRQQNNDGVMSMARYFMYGGAPSVLATRWQVNDQATAFVMQNFYKYLYEGKSTREAIRAAQLDYLSQAKGIAAHPFYWAAFMNIGNTDEGVYIAHKNWAIPYYVMIILSIAVLSFGAWWKWGQKAKRR